MQGDLNSLLGSDIIAEDPNIQNENGKLLSNFQLVMVNYLPLCRGLITRQRDSINGKHEKGVLIFFVVCIHVIPYIRKMVIDEAMIYITKTTHSEKKM